MSNIPRISQDGITIATALAKALLAFATDDPTRPNQSGLGFDDCMIAATCGKTAARIHNLDVSACNGAVPNRWNGRHWSGAYVREQIKSAGKAPSILLAWDRASEKGFPPVSQAIGAMKRSFGEGPIGVCPRLLGRLEALSDALRGKRPRKGYDTAESILVSAPGPMDPLIFEIRGTEVAGVVAEIAIMPMRVA